MKSILLTISALALITNGFSQAPVAEYLFNGNANDNSINANNGTVSGATLTTDRFGNPNKAYAFNGSNSLITIGDVTYLDGKTTASWNWWMSTTFSSFNAFVSAVRKDNAWIPMQYAYSQTYWRSILFDMSTGVANTPFPSGTVKYDGRWDMFTVIKRTDSLLVYKNDTLIAKTMYVGALVNSANFLMFGGSGVGQEPYNGKLDDVRIWDRAITKNEMTQLFYEAPCTQYVAVTDTLIINANLTGIPKPNNINTLKIYPNPSKDHIIIDNGVYGNMTGYSIKIQNTLSQTVFQSGINQQQFNIDLNTFTGGMGTYFLYLYDNTSKLIEVKKIILQ